MNSFDQVKLLISLLAFVFVSHISTLGMTVRLAKTLGFEGRPNHCSAIAVAATSPRRAISSSPVPALERDRVTVLLAPNLKTSVRYGAG